MKFKANKSTIFQFRDVWHMRGTNNLAILQSVANLLLLRNITREGDSQSSQAHKWI